MSVSVNPPKTPVTKGSNGIAAATIPNICKMPGPPAPFVPAPLPNIGRSGSSPKGYSKKVKVEGKAVAIKGASFKSVGDVASKGTGGGIVSSNTHGPTKFVGPGSLDVKFEGKNVQLLTDPMLNNCGPSGSPANAATMEGVMQKCGKIIVVGARVCPLCDSSSHDALEETTETQDDAEELASAYERNLGGAAKNKPTMLAAVRCKCPRKYANQSGKNTGSLKRAADDTGMKCPSTDPKTESFQDSESILAAIQRRADAARPGVFSQVVTIADEYSKLCDELEYLPIGYPPGQCGAQGAVVLALEDGAHPVAITERWFSPGGADTTGNRIQYVDELRGRGNVINDTFSPGDSVPPCRTCDAILPLLLCFEKAAPCPHI